MYDVLSAVLSAVFGAFNALYFQERIDKNRIWHDKYKNREAMNSTVFVICFMRI
jgi:hypothetical protein